MSGVWNEKHVPWTATRPFAEAGDFAAAVDENLARHVGCAARRRFHSRREWFSFIS